MAGSIAIVGMSCRFPGGSNSLEKLWKMCEEGKDCRSEVPKGRYNVDGFYRPDPDRNGSVRPTRMV
jgi:acyl transferase domain-containing protein